MHIKAGTYSGMRFDACGWWFGLDSEISSDAADCIRCQANSNFLGGYY